MVSCYRRNIETTSLITFKIAHTGENMVFEVPTNISIANFIEFAKNNAYNRFQIRRNQEIEIVQAGQHIYGLRDEEAPALIPEFNTTFQEKYNGLYNNLCFYIRFTGLQNNRQQHLSLHLPTSILHSEADVLNAPR